MKCGRRYMHGKRRRRSPIKQDVDTTAVDRVYTEERVNTDLRKKGLHTEGEDKAGTSIRGNVDTTPNLGANTGGGIQPTNTNLM